LAEIFDKPDVEWEGTVSHQTLQAGAILRAHAHRGVERETAVLPGEHLADIITLDQPAAVLAAEQRCA